MLLILHPYRRLISSSAIRLIASNHLLRPTHFPLSSPPLRFFHASTRLFPAFPSKPISRTRSVFSIRINGFSYTPGFPQAAKLTRRMEELGIEIDSCLPGQYNYLLCPMCNGGSSMEKSLSLFIEHDWVSACWMCFRAKCCWKGSTKASADIKPSNGSLIPVIKPKKIIRTISEESLGLEPLNNELLAYFAERSISKETLERNLVMQKRSYSGQVEIAFTYRRKGALVSCKYRGVAKSFRLEKDTERIFYGLDDIEGETDIIIVEGEMDKLAMAEIGLHNCVSVPDGAPPSVSKNEVPPEDQDTKYQYLWNCKEYLKKASRIILATDGDEPGKALAEELVRRIGRERCWRVQWPKINEVDHFKDANEVLMILGADALKEVIDNAELYPIPGLHNFRDYFDEIDAYYHRTHVQKTCNFGAIWRVSENGKEGKK